MTQPKKWHNLVDKIPGQIYLCLATLIFGISSAVTRKLTEIGTQHLIENRNPISLCNVLFVGNLCALLVLVMIYWRQWNKANLQQLSKQNWFYLAIVAILSGALAPSLFFQALAITNVNNVVLVGRLEPPLTLALSVWCLKERVTRWQVLGAFLAFVGVVLTIILQPPEKSMLNMGGLTIGLGEILTAIASVAVAIATIITKQHLSQIPVGIYSIFRTALGTVIFFFIALTLYGQQHFIDVFSPFLWQWMLLYSAVIVVLGQLLWLKGFKTSSVATTTLVSSVTPIISSLGAYLILGEIPTQAQYIGGCLVLVGIFLSQIPTKRQTNELISKMSLTQIEQKMAARIGFKGF
ncbi:DMT family transporter [Sphaerospermopsis aphanizomenoides BCCUSP55]|uniref:DMT family transporter n=1 Tax=Sphaerospermopsis aphanizomenoides TaxID=459663 RepID=UPI001903535D|nr:DMT family transporter [Sphaerospermopsis aphanizomenoides]MBK1989358.1 DMT family transporter [Sphaerospermopsis aphanizomenoides BCCUSP55]